MANPFEKFAQAINPFAQFKPHQEAMKPIATTPDGGKVFRMDDGQLSFSSPGYATNDQEAIASIMEGATPLDEAQRTTDNLTLLQAPIAARVQEFNQGAPLVGEWLDEAVGLVSPKAAEGMRALSGAMERQNPGESAALNIGGGVAYTLPMLLGQTGAKAANWVGNGASRITRAGRAALVAAPAGIVEGATSFSGRAEPGKRIEGAAAGAVIGGGLSMALSGFAPLIGEGVASLAKRIKKLDVATIANEFGLSPSAARVVKSYLAADDLDAATAVLARNGDDAMLASAGPATLQALDTAASTGGKALAVTRQRVGDAVNTAGKKFLGAIDNILGDADGGIKGAIKTVYKTSKEARQKAYDFAYSQPTPTVGKVWDDLQGVLGRIAPDDFKAAIKEANAEMVDSGYVNQNIMATIGDDGSVTLSQPLSVLQLDYIARGLSNVVEQGTDAIKGASPAARRAQGQLKDLREILKKNVAGYAAALKVGGDTAQQREAIVMGRGLLTEGTTPEDVRNFVRSAISDEAKAALRKGLRESIEAVMNRARTTISDLESGAMDFTTGQNAAAEAVGAIRGLLTKGNMIKTRLVLGGDDMKRLFSEMQKMADAMVLRSAVARGSATAIRTAGQEQMAAEVAPGIVRRTVGNIGNPFDAAREISRELVGIDARTISDQQRQYFAEIADALTRIRGPEALRALQAVKDAMAGQPMKDADAQLIGRLVAGAATVGAYQGSKRPLTPQ